MRRTIGYPWLTSKASVVSAWLLIALFSTATVGAETALDIGDEPDQSHLGVQAEDLEQEVVRLRVLLRASEERNADLLNAIGDLRVQMDDLAAENTHLQSRYDDVTARLDTATLEVEALQGVVSASRDEFANTRSRVNGIVRRTLFRTAQGVTANLAATAGKSIPFYGVAIIVAATTYDLALSCLTMRDMNELSQALGLDEYDQEVLRVCGLSVPTREDLWQGLVTSPELAWRASGDGLSALRDLISQAELPDFPDYLIPELPDPDFGGVWQRSIELWEWADRGWGYTRDSFDSLWERAWGDTD